MSGEGEAAAIRRQSVLEDAPYGSGRRRGDEGDVLVAMHGRGCMTIGGEGQGGGGEGGRGVYLLSCMVIVV